MKNQLSSLKRRDTNTGLHSGLSGSFKISLLFFCMLIGLSWKNFSVNNLKTASLQKEDQSRQQPETVKIQDKKGNLVLHFNTHDQGAINYVEVLGHAVITNKEGVFSAIKSDGSWFTSHSNSIGPKIITEGDWVTIENIFFGEEKNRVKEKWTFHSCSDYIDWTIERSYSKNMTLEDTGFPQWSFDNMDTWTGALLGTGGWPGANCSTILMLHWETIPGK